ncbi:phosphoethanolamine--lipid A transferase [Shewanella sp. NIFS-20-20]|nr:phosphoethanolamine--lipid A transferase [Shewanella sp. NIFS-20-20]
MIAVWYVLVFNWPLWEFVAAGLNKQGDFSRVFALTMPVFLWAALSFIFSLISPAKLIKPLFIPLTLLSSIVFFAGWKYGVVFDYSMMENVFQTHPAEASMYLNFSAVSAFALSGVLPALIIWKLPITALPMAKAIKQRALFMVAMLVIIGAIVALFMQNYLAFGRNNDEIKRMVVPTYFIGSLVKYINRTYVETPLPYQQLGLDAQVTLKKAKPNLMVLVVGETARAQNYAYYGYGKNTNPYTEKYPLQVFADVSSCGTATAVSLPCMFSRFNREQYDPRHAKAQDNLIDVLHHAGIDVLWLDNDGGCKGVCARVKTINIALDSEPTLCNGSRCLDQVLVDQLQRSLLELTDDNTLIVLHIMGSHGPTYYQRYPESMRRFSPDCQRSDIQNCSKEALVNTYDNSLVYTDYVLSEVIAKLETVTDFDTAMLYISDHGESLGEMGLYLHGTPYSMAPKEQTHIPMLTWFSPDYLAQNHLSLACIEQQAAQGHYSQDNLFDTVLGLLNVNTQEYRPDQDILKLCRKD